MGKTKAAFLDRDGTINVEKGYISIPAQIELIPGSAEAIKMLNAAGFRVFGISNQSGVARGYYTAPDVVEVNRRVTYLLEASGAHVDEIFFCPHHPDGSVPEWTRACDCRKPAAGLVRRAADKFGLELGDIVVVGDKICDVELGKNVGGRTALVATGFGEAERAKLEANGGPRPDIYAADLFEAVRLLLERA